MPVYTGSLSNLVTALVNKYAALQNINEEGEAFADGALASFVIVQVCNGACHADLHSKFIMMRRLF